MYEQFVAIGRMKLFNQLQMAHRASFKKQEENRGEGGGDTESESQCQLGNQCLNQFLPNNVEGGRSLGWKKPRSKQPTRIVFYYTQPLTTDRPSKYESTVN